MEFPFDLSIIWLSILLSILFVVAFVFRSSCYPTLRKQQSFCKVNNNIFNTNICDIFLFERLHIVYRKIPTKETGSNSIDEEHCFPSLKLYFKYRGGNKRWGKISNCSHLNIEKVV
ncbi:hypothetical protein BKP37_18525 [Anaerobacillus alkalilacustris]|uniref:Uncharacterized protein n=1 Tax=Anaerobacillus alkalilacustris TaxID=393763 RepID=A0A1S2LE66_9BACI|nr:hypothetical protein BKP37_18525 [Anaerobacillus alkalilacustris]